MNSTKLEEREVLSWYLTDSVNLIGNGGLHIVCLMARDLWAIHSKLMNFRTSAQCSMKMV